MNGENLESEIRPDTFFITECSNIRPSALLESRQAPVRNRFAYQQMEKGIVGRGYGSSKISLRGGRWILMGQINRLLQGIVVISHVSYAHSGSFRRACSDWLRKLK
jgi:hypothetical protein